MEQEQKDGQGRCKNAAPVHGILTDGRDGNGSMGQRAHGKVTAAGPHGCVTYLTV